MTAARILFVLAVLAELYGATRLLYAGREATAAIRAGSLIKPDEDGVPYWDPESDSGLAALRAIRVPVHAGVVLLIGIVLGFAGNIAATL